MTYRRVARFLGVMALCALCGCGIPILSSGDLSNQVMTYSTAFMGATTGYVPNGHDTVSFTFDSTGRAGAYVEELYTYGYATQADVTADDYSKSTWNQTGGYKGEFTYTGESCSFSLTITEVYAPKAGAVAMTNGEYAAASFSYQDIAKAWDLEMAALKLSTNLLFTIDDLEPVYPASGDAWESTSTMNVTMPILGEALTVASTTVATVSIADDAVSLTTATSSVQTYMGASAASHSTEETVYAVEKRFIIGQSDTAGAAFADVWKYGNKVCFQLNRTGYTYRDWEGDTKPDTEPTVDTATGHVESSGGTPGTDAWNWNIDNRVVAEARSYSHGGSYIVDLQQGMNAVRGIMPRR
jgi:hypothetical protein